MESRQPATATATAPAFKFNPTHPDFVQDPYPTYARMRREAPRLQALGTRILTRYDDVLAVLKHRDLSVALIPDTIQRMASRLRVERLDQIDRFIRSSIVFTDNPAHVRLRRLVNQAYTPRAVARLAPLIDDEIAACLRAFDDGAPADLIAALARPLPVHVLCRWMRVEATHRADIAHHVHNVRLLLDPGMMGRRDYVRAAESLAWLIDFFSAHADGPAAAHEGVVRDLVAARADDDRLSHEEVAFACVMFYVAGTETTQSLIGNVVLALVRHPRQLALLRERPELVERAVEESIRYDTPLQFTKRVARTATEVNGIAIAAGEQILACMGAANRDEDVFERADVFDCLRTGAPHVGFGYGLHACLGGQLARLQAERALHMLLARYPAWDLDPTGVTWQSESLILRGPAALRGRLLAALAEADETLAARGVDGE
ncbi:cytochrome P450 [Burkholderia sp. FERM BP-3421]|jgi:cytochrome P450|uniref:cytochrome P450 n=1 Tax=Burkholderia sp. FERM BP-3421 TaxID=1494466 RepID=UPI00236233D2|nr:cytochrome P450 [Burkholderia sp. FERM BP-3421]WDD92374.1 cytochrome P450 [Burkholderia sp. FERM BP-3421]